QMQKRLLGSAAILLFLFYNASSTISSYYALGPIGRNVYVVTNARIESNKPKSI
ncbi:hypothetical protein K504DRAFT_387199, partial [Pleomassaria siparia CBS 279.74]